MPAVPLIIKLRRRRLTTSRHPSLQRFGLATAYLVSLSIAILLLAATFTFASVTRQLPSPAAIPLLIEPPDGAWLQPTRFYSRDGEHVLYTLENPAIKERRYLPIRGTTSQSGDGPFLSPSLITATIAIADPTFWSHPGFTSLNLHPDQPKTIAQRLVSELLLREEGSGLWRTLRENLLAAQITSQFGRLKVMEWYLNNANFGNLAFGAEGASQIYFGKSAADLNLAEAAVLAGVAEAPALNPLDAPKTALERALIVIDAMVGQGLITPQEAEAARNTEIVFQQAAPALESIAPGFIQLVIDQLAPNVPIEWLERGGFEIITTLDYNLQLQATCTVQTHLARLQGDFSEIPTLNGSTCEASRLLPTLAIPKTAQMDQLAAEVLILDPNTGEILAYAGQTPGKRGAIPFDRHPAGTLTTPFLYLTAFARGFAPASLVWDIPLDVSDPSFQQFNQGHDYQGPVRLRYALANDYLSPAIQILDQVGVENVIQTAHQLGMPSLTLENPTAAPCPGCRFLFESGEITLLEAVQAFSVFARQGLQTGQPASPADTNGLQVLEPISILEIREASNRLALPLPPAETRPVLTTELAYLITHILGDESARWPSLGHPNPLEIGRPAGVKLGRTPANRHAWTVGFTPQLVTGVWMGIPDSVEEGEVDPEVAAALWHALIQYATREYPAVGWTPPPTVTSVDVCDPSGMLPTLQCPTVVNEVFITGQEPTHPDTLFQSYQINRETGRLATIFTPPELIEERIYLNVPPEAASWAETTGLQTPPETYDAIYTPPMLAEANITEPSMFSYVRGELRVRGTASGDDFTSYRLQVGEGLNPSGWIIIHEDDPSPVQDGLLGTWDTSGLNGLYALQLVVLRKNQGLDSATIQITIDNTPPTVIIPYPEADHRYTAKTLTLQAQVFDNLGIQQVEFYINNRLVATQTQPPFAFPWNTRPGGYIFTVRVTDFAGNASESSVYFSVGR